MYTAMYTVYTGIPVYIPVFIFADIRYRVERTRASWYPDPRRADSSIVVSARMQSVEKIKADLKEAKEAGDISLEEFLAELKKLRPIVADRPADARKKDAIDSHCMHLMH